MRALTVAKYLTINTTPFLRRYKLIAAVLLILAAVFLALILTSPGGRPATKSSGFVRALREMGLTKSTVTSAISSFLTVLLLLAMLTRGGGAFLMEEAEYEILMAQPIDMRSYIAGKILCELLGNLQPTAFYLLSMLLLSPPKSDLIRVLLLVAAMLLLSEYLSLLLSGVRISKALLGERYRFVRWGVALYALAGIVHSVVTMSVSPVLRAPFEVPVEAVVYYAAVSESDLSIGVRVAATLAIVIVLLALIYKLADRIHPEDIRGGPLTSEKPLKSRPLYSEISRVAVMRQILMDLMSRDHLKLLIGGLLTSTVAGLLTRYLMSRTGLSTQDVGFVLSIIALVVVSEITLIVSGVILSRDLAPLWIYRVYLSDMSPVAEFIILKLVIYLSEVFLGISLFYVVMTGELVYILLPIAMLSVSAFTACSTVGVLVYLSSKRKIVKEAPSGMYTLEKIALTAVSVIILPTVLGGTILFQFTSNRVLMSVISAASALLIGFVGSRLVGRTMGSVDLVS